MRSPFPGVDPYLESQRYWRDFHSKFINAWQETLLAQLPPRYDARMDEEVYIGRIPPDDVERLVLPDVAVVAGTGRRHADRGVAVEDEVSLKPVVIPHRMLAERRVSFLEIRDQRADQLVAVLELLSPTNKIWGRAKYLKKRRALRRARVHLVEVDLLQGGKPLPLAMPPPPAHCRVYLTRGDHVRDCEVYSWDLPDPLPVVPIPLLPPDPDLKSSLRAVFDLAYERGQYPRAIDYSLPLDLPLDARARAWAEEVAARFSPAH